MLAEAEAWQQLQIFIFYSFVICASFSWAEPSLYCSRRTAKLSVKAVIHHIQLSEATGSVSFVVFAVGLWLLSSFADERMKPGHMRKHKKVQRLWKVPVFDSTSDPEPGDAPCHRGAAEDRWDGDAAVLRGRGRLRQHVRPNHQGRGAAVGRDAYLCWYVI